MSKDEVKREAVQPRARHGSNERGHQSDDESSSYARQAGGAEPLGRFNESMRVKSARPTTASSTASSTASVTARRSNKRAPAPPPLLRQITSANGTVSSKIVLFKDESYKESWLLRIISQILRADSIQDVQNWLVSAGAEGSHSFIIIAWTFKYGHFGQNKTKNK